MKCRERFMSEVRSLALVTCAFAAALAVPAWGQDGPAAGSGDEIIVTANKRSQNLQDVGLSVSAISGDALKNQQISNLADVAQIVPGLTFSQTANDTPVYTLRGVGFRSEEHTSELQSLMRISYAVFCLKKKTNQ